MMATPRVNRPHRKPGRKLKRLPATIEQIESLAGIGLTEEEIASYLGITRMTLYKRKKRNPAVDAAMKAGKIKADASVLKSLFERATTAAGDTTAMIFWLKNRQPDRWRDRHEIDANVKVVARLSLREMKKSLKQIDEEKAEEETDNGD